MNCPLCAAPATLEDVWHDNECSTTDYRCENGHLIQFVVPQNWMTVLLLEEDGTELYQLHFDNDDQIINVLDCDTNEFIDLEGSGVRQSH